MPPSEAGTYDHIVRRITRVMGALAVLGAVAITVGQGWKFGLGFLLGAALSYLSFWRWQRLVETLTEASKARSFTLMMLRFVVLAAAAYGIVKYLEVNPVAVLLGLLVCAAAVIVSLIFELVFRTKS